MNILAGMTTNRTHITAKGAPTPFAEKLNKLVVDSLATISKVMKKEFRGASLGKFRVHDFEYENGLEYITLYTPPYDTPAIVSIQIRADSFEKVLSVGVWIYDADAFYDGEELDYYNELQGEIKFEDISDIEESLEYALLNPNVLRFTLPEFKKAVRGFAKYLQKKIGSKINSSRMNATIIDFMEKIKDYYGITDNKIKFQLMPVADARSSSISYALSGFGDALFFLVKHPKIKEDLWCKVTESMSSGRIELFFGGGDEKWTGYYIPADATYSLPPLMKGLEAIRWQTTLDSKSKKAVEAVIYGWKYFIRNTSDSVFIRR